MSLWIDEKYLKMIGSRLEGFKATNTHTFNCRCPLCGDSKKKASKKRGYFYARLGKLFYSCKNCGASLLFGTFLKDIDINLYKQYNMESFKEKLSNAAKFELEDIPVTKKYIPDIFSDLPLVNEMDEESEAYLWCEKRHLPIDTFSFHFAENFIEWTKGNTDKFKVWKGPDHPRIVIPWRDREGKIIGYSARIIRPPLGDEQKYYRIFVDDSVKEHFFGLDRLDETKQIYVLEGEIDSLMIPNAIAVSNGKLHTYINKGAIYVPDADKRNKHICKNISDMLDLGLDVCLLPESLPGKDLNELVQHGFTSGDLIDIINANTVSGLTGKLVFNKWKVVA